MLTEFASYEVFWVIGMIMLTALVIILIGAGQRFPGTVASLLVAAVILTGFSIRPSGLYAPPPAPAEQPAEIVWPSR